MTLYPRRKSDRQAYDAVKLLAGLAAALALLASYVSYRAIHAVDEFYHTSAEIMKLSSILEKLPKMPKGMERQ